MIGVQLISETAPAPRPWVSIVVPTFDRLEYVRPALDSVFAQTWNDWDLIIADDGSGEELRAYLRALESRPRVKVVWLPHRGVPSAVRNAAIREATGTHVAFLDSDDLWAPRKLERQLALLAARPECGWSYTAFRQVDPQWKADTTVAAMRDVRFPVQGFQRTYWEFFPGFGFFVTTLLLAVAALS